MTREELVTRVTDHLRHAIIPARPEFADVGWPWTPHTTGHTYDGACALCRMDIPDALPTVVGVILDYLATLDTEEAARDGDKG